jgi:molybdopterin synthase sulfur carrier subunit
MVEILYFARIKELVGMDREQLQLPQGIADISALIDHLCGDRGDEWSAALRQENLLIAVNQTMVKSDQRLGDGDEVAFFPPVTGG